MPPSADDDRQERKKEMKQSIPVYRNAAEKIADLGEMCGRLEALEKEVERLKERINLVATIGVIRGYDDVN